MVKNADFGLLDTQKAALFAPPNVDLAAALPSPCFVTSKLEPYTRNGIETTGTVNLTQTASAVRDLQIQLGRARVKTPLRNIMILTKAKDNNLIKLTRELAFWIMQQSSESSVYVDAQLRYSSRFKNVVTTDQRALLAKVKFWNLEMCTTMTNLFDLCITLGGDGTVLFSSFLFQKVVPPVLSFSLGSLGFLTNFTFNSYPSVLTNMLTEGYNVNLRMRFHCVVYRAIEPTSDEEGKKRRSAIRRGDTGEIFMKNLEKGGWESVESADSSPSTNKQSSAWSGSASAGDKEIMCFATRPAESFQVLNDLVVDRGPSPYVSQLELFADDHHLTTVQADGLTVSTPTGSTAYSLSAGGSLVSPDVSAFLLTPICPHTLSFRPMILPDSVELRVCVPYNSRSTAWASFDGRGRVELKQGDHIKIVASRYPFPTVCKHHASKDWFNSIARTLKWNERERQKSFVVIEESRTHKNHILTKKADGSSTPMSDVSQDPYLEEELENEVYDIDDSSVIGSEVGSPVPDYSEDKNTNDTPAATKVLHTFLDSPSFQEFSSGDPFALLPSKSALFSETDLPRTFSYLEKSEHDFSDAQGSNGLLASHSRVDGSHTPKVTQGFADSYQENNNASDVRKSPSTRTFVVRGADAVDTESDSSHAGR